MSHRRDAAWLDSGLARRLTLLDRERASSSARCAIRCCGFRSQRSMLRLRRCSTRWRAASELPVATRPTGIEHGTVTVIIDQQPVEVATSSKTVNLCC
jgi:hypothetical protein